VTTLINFNVQLQLANQLDNEEYNFPYLEIMDNFMFAMLGTHSYLSFAIGVAIKFS
jgi:hypothetical protein